MQNKEKQRTENGSTELVEAGKSVVESKNFTMKLRVKIRRHEAESHLRGADKGEVPNDKMRTHENASMKSLNRTHIG
jgi:hypothetical protein